MIRINLLPHRALRRAQRRREFYAMVIVAFLFALLVVGFVWFAITGYVSNQRDRNGFIQGEIAKLDAQIKEIADLRKDIDGLKARQQAVQDLQSDRNLPVHLLDELVKQVPEGIYLQSVKQDGLRVSLTGVAQSNDRVSELLRNLANNSAWFESPDLVEIHSATVGGKRLNQFTMNVTLKRPVEQDDGHPKAANGSTPQGNG